MGAAHRHIDATQAGRQASRQQQQWRFLCLHSQTILSHITCILGGRVCNRNIIAISSRARSSDPQSQRTSTHNKSIMSRRPPSPHPPPLPNRVGVDTVHWCANPDGGNHHASIHKHVLLAHAGCARIGRRTYTTHTHNSLRTGPA